VPGTVTLTTDFGTRDSYVAQLKGVLLAGCADVLVHDLTHGIAPHDVVEGALFLAGAVPAFPPGTVHLAVVDPGVGGDRRRIAVEVAGQRVVCPDNGLLTLLARSHPIDAVHELTNPRFWREPASATFEGRDMFAPAAAHLACGGALADLGPSVAEPMQLALPEPSAGDREGIPPASIKCVATPMLEGTCTPTRAIDRRGHGPRRNLRATLRFIRRAVLRVPFPPSARRSADARPPPGACPARPDPRRPLPLPDRSPGLPA